MIITKERERQIEDKPEIPYIGIHSFSSNPLIVIFTKPGYGTVIRKGSGTSYEIGDTKDFNENNFEKYNKELVLWNVE